MTRSRRFIFRVLADLADLVVSNRAFSDEHSKVAAGIFLGLCIMDGAGLSPDQIIASFERDLPGFISIATEVENAK